MNTNSEFNAVQAHLQEFWETLAQHSELAGRLSLEDLPQLLEAGLAQVLTAALKTQRDFHLQDHPEDRANGYAPERTLHVGATAVPVNRPRTRQAFYPALLPKHQRHLPEAYQQLLRTLGLGYSPEQVQQLLEELHQEATQFFHRPLGPDWLCVFIDAKIIELKDEQDQVKQAVHFLALGIGLDGKKEVLAAMTFWGNEVLESWRQFLIQLKNRGLVRVLLLLTDDFSGLASLIASLFPNTDHQLCTVHLLRNAQRHLSPDDYLAFKERWAEVLSASSFETAQSKFRQLLERIRPKNKAYVEHLEKRTAQYLMFTKYPVSIRPQLRSTNLPEGLNNQIENLRRNAGGHFHSQREALIKMKLLADQLYERKWTRVSPRLVTQLGSLNQAFRQKFEPELTPQNH